MLSSHPHTHLSHTHTPHTQTDCLLSPLDRQPSLHIDHAVLTPTHPLSHTHTSLSHTHRLLIKSLRQTAIFAYWSCCPHTHTPPLSHTHLSLTHTHRLLIKSLTQAAIFAYWSCCHQQADDKSFRSASANIVRLCLRVHSTLEQCRQSSGGSQHFVLQILNGIRLKLCKATSPLRRSSFYVFALCYRCISELVQFSGSTYALATQTQRKLMKGFPKLGQY